MLPSETDRQSWRPVLIFWGGVAVLLYFVGWVPQVPETMVEWFLMAIGYLAYVFGLTIAVDIIFIVIIAVLERLLMTLKGARVEY
jgi:high-affinity nickel permease